MLDNQKNNRIFTNQCANQLPNPDHKFTNNYQQETPGGCKFTASERQLRPSGVLKCKRPTIYNSLNRTTAC